MSVSHLQNKAIHLIVVDRWSKHDVGGIIAKSLKVTRSTVNRWRATEEFKEELTRQIELFRHNFDDVKLADRKERVLCLSELYDTIDDKQVQLKIKVLTAIRQEVGDDKQVVEVQHTGEVGLRLPPRASNYEEWMDQNRKMEAVEAESVEVVDG
jgi:hypothetical protein